MSDIKDEEKRNKECLFKVEKTKNEEIDELLATQYDLEEENGKIKIQANQTQKIVDTLNADKSKLEERLAQEVSGGRGIGGGGGGGGGKEGA